jgi:hypothetical protein
VTPLPAARGLADLRALLDLLRRERELVAIDAEVDPDLELAEVHRRVIAAGGPALLFRRVKGSPWPVVTNLFGTQRRVELAFGPRPEALVQALAAAPHTLLPPRLAALWQHRDLLLALLRAGRTRVARAPLLQCVDRPPALSRLPLLRTWPEDGGAFVTLPLVLTEHPDGTGSNLGMYRIQRFDDQRVGLPGMVEVARALLAEVPGLRVVLPHRDGRRTPLLRQILADEDAAFVEHHEGDLAPWLAGARLVLAKSGTGSLEACLHCVPVVVVYQLHSLLATLGYHNILSVPYIAAANLIAGAAVVPEFCFHRQSGGQRVLAAVRELWADGERRSRCIADLAAVRSRLGAPGAAARAAAVVRAFLARQHRPAGAD